MTSSTQNPHNTTSAPPPTPSSTTTATTKTSTATDLLSRLLHRLPPNLSTTPTLLRRRSSLTTTTTISPPVISYNDLKSTLLTALPSISKLGYFQLTNHPIPYQLAHSAVSDSLSIFNLSHHEKHQHFPKNWPLGFDDGDDDNDDVLFLDSSCSTESTELSLSNLREFTWEIEKIGLTVVEALLCAMGLQNPCLNDPNSVCSLMWMSDGSGGKMVGSGKFYPYVVGLHYQVQSGRYSLLSDSGCVSVETPKDSILVTLGDIAQVWSNGKLNKVRGKPTQNIEEGNVTPNISMSLLVTLPLESTISTLLPRVMVINDGNNSSCESQNEDDDSELKEESMFNSFSFEDYAWRVYHERVPLKDPLDRCRTSTNM